MAEAREEALHLADLFLKMIKGSITEEERDELEEASVLQDIAHMPARGKMRGAWLAYYAGIIENRRKIADKR